MQKNSCLFQPNYIATKSATRKWKSSFSIKSSAINDETRPLSVVVGGLITSSDNALDFDSEICSVLLIFLKYLLIG